MDAEDQTQRLTDGRFDIVIAGGGLAGLTLAKQLRMERPELRIAVVERTSRPLPLAAHKVGESSVELGSQYLERLGLREYLLDNHIVKFGLRLFPGGGDRPIEERLELGPGAEPVATSYQLDRGKLESDLRAMIEEEGATLLEGARVQEVTLAAEGELHLVRLELGGEEVTLRARWFVDATGRSAFLRKRMKLGRASGHAASAGWFRVSGRVDINDMVADPDHPWRQQPMAEDRWRSTCHFMGDGYWVWLLPLAGGRTSVGIVAHEDRHAFDQLNTLERCWAFLDAHEPHVATLLRAHLEAGEEVLDFRCLKRYSHDIERSFSADRWAAVGEAGAFVDPLYSPGTDFIAVANSMAAELIRTDAEGGDLAARCQELDDQYATFVQMGLCYFQGAAPVYGHAAAMTAKVYWDNFFYWNYHCQYFQQRIYTLSGAELRPFTEIGGRFFQLSRYVQQVVRQWALLAPEDPSPGFLGMPAFASLGVESHVGVLHEMGREETLAYMKMRLVQAEEMVAEITLRALTELGPERGQILIDEARLGDWELAITPDRGRLAASAAERPPEARSLVVQDLERNLHPLRPHPQAAQALGLLVDVRRQGHEHGLTTGQGV